MLKQLELPLAGRYAIERELTRGGMAIIYLARDLKYERPVAVKVLQPRLSVTLGPERFLREIQIAAHLTHPHILPLHDSGEVEGLLYYVMPYVAGQTLRSRLGREHQLPVADTVAVLRQVLDALAYAHGQGVIHRDIKPENVLLAGRNAMVIDFGVAKAVTLATSVKGRPTLGMVLGTPEYVSPEQASSSPDIDHRTDIYAVGAMAYELLTSQPPFTAPSPQRVLAAQIHQAPRPVTELRRMPQPLADLVMRALHKAPEARWQSAEEMLAQLDRVRASTPPVSPVKPAEPPSHPPPAPLPPPPPEPAATPWKGILALAIIALAVVMLLGAAVVVFLRPIGG